MNLKQYVKDATRTESQIEKVVLKDPQFFVYALKIFIAAGNILDCYKKEVFYGKEPVDMLQWARKIDHYGYQLEKAEPELNIDPRVFHALIGIATEASELMEALDSVVTGGEELDYVNVLEEFGDINWYEAIGVDAMDGDLENVLTTNIEKLRKRFPEKFTNEDAIERDTDEERNTLEEGLTLDKEPSS